MEFIEIGRLAELYWRNSCENGSEISSSTKCKQFLITWATINNNRASVRF
jgi:hypothetical protein